MTYRNSVYLHEAAIRAFVERYCVDERPNFGARVRAKELHDSYVAFCKNTNFAAAGVKAFGTVLGRIGFEHMKSGCVWWCGLRLKVSP